MELLVVNGGLILTHPFLTHLFKLSNYLSDDNTFASPQNQNRAVHLVHFMATGENFRAEPELVIPKILCGMNIQDPISLDITLTNEEMDYANELLLALINRWEKLGQTSIEGLRNTFFQRAALLEEKDDTYQLTIENSGVDVLLDFIPWQINIVQLAWAEKVIHTSWR